MIIWSYIKSIYSIIDIQYSILDKIKKTIDTEKFDKAKIFIDTDYKLPVDITLKNVLKNINNFYPQIFLEKALFVK